ncbi:ABC transporter ATP-binding protein [Bacillus altitudinis]|uniref:ABC transporter ATP-binding protein n=1 Tax=Bacillus altitudinis TaxID=293387 RepID=UPI001071F6B1|nr:ABC transporter ATP-binding protein [Bacillus altitudinis]QEO60835.1 ABC transporter ATP-binding protein [Bacillus altitudinis]
MEKGLHVKGLCIGTDQKVLVKDVDMILEDSKWVALIGESGSGKTLTGLSIGGLLPKNIKITSGQIFLDGEALVELSEKKIHELRGKRISYIFQNYAEVFIPHLPLCVQLHEILVVHSKLDEQQRKTVISKTLDEVGLSYEFIQGRYSFQLSGGQLQRVAIAAAILLKPRVIIADEPTTALDPQSAKQVLELLKKIKIKTHCSILFTTHDLSIARSYADEIAVMYRGQIVEKGTSKDLLSGASHEYTQKLIAADVLLNKHPQTTNHSRRRKDLGKSVHFREYPILEVHKLTKQYCKQHEVLKEVSLKIKTGESVGLIGPSGCGKSTLARCILQLEPFDGGELYFKGRRIKGNLKDVALHGSIQAVFQQPALALNHQLTILDSLMEPLDLLKRSFSQRRQYRNQRMQLAAQLMEQVDLSPKLLQRYPQQLSGGQKQRVSIARAISTNPAFLILDEPTASLDMLVQAQIISLLQTLQKKMNYSALVISHDYRSLSKLSDRVIRIEKGRIGDLEEMPQVSKG